MMKIYNDITELIGATPLMKLKNYSEKHSLYTPVLAKLEYFNPAASVKDRAALSLIEDGERRGLINKDTVIIEPTSGNTGIGLAAVAATRGYKVILTMPETMSAERRMLLAAYGAKIVLTPGSEGMTGAVNEANRLAASYPSAYNPGQFDNPANPDAHRKTTGPEIYADTDGRVDIFVAGAGTGGTVSGVGEYLKSKNPNVLIYAVEPASSPLISKGTAGAHKLQGIGANFIPKNYNADVVDGVIAVSNEDAYDTARELPKTDGILVGISSGAAVFAARTLAEKPENAGKVIVALLPDTGERYLSTAGLFSEVSE
ncbi:MAG: cysteine synthase A [Ruminococcaceae bacterium]|nr:cysteine synthase A [Oscillospiraceae bacterium]